jgi:hypothetical protein
MYAVTVATAIQARDVGGDKLAFGFSERRRAPQQHFVKLEPWLLVSGNILKTSSNVASLGIDGR